MVITVIVAAVVVLITFSFHYAVLRWLSGGMARIAIHPSQRVLSIAIIVFLAHVSEILLYAATYAISVESLGLGTFGGLVVEQPLDFLYFSSVTYTSLGLGDVFPTGHIRFLSGVEALNGLLLIAWSGSFIYLAMGRLWPWERCVEPELVTKSKSNRH